MLFLQALKYSLALLELNIYPGVGQTGSQAVSVWDLGICFFYLVTDPKFASYSSRIQIAGPACLPDPGVFGVNISLSNDLTLCNLYNPLCNLYNPLCNLYNPLCNLYNPLCNLFKTSCFCLIFVQIFFMDVSY